MDEIQKATEVILRFTEEMNDWEEKIYILSRIRGGKHVSDENKSRVEDESVESLNAQYEKAFAAHCTVRERMYSGPNSYGKPTKYAGISSATIVETAQPKPNRIEITASKGHLEESYIFILTKKLDTWKIDSLKAKIGNETPRNVVL